MRRRVRRIGSRLLGLPEIVYRAPGRPAAVALTFDDGPSSWTGDIAGTLEAHDCRGTFFLLGAAVERHPGTVAALRDAGHEIGNHLWSHADPASQSRGEIRAEIDRTAAAIERASGTSPVLVRPPYCGAPEHIARAARGGGADMVVLRSVDPEDWLARSPEDVVERVLAAAGPGDVVSLHDGVAPANRGTDARTVTAAAVGQLVPALIERGLRPVTVSQLFR